MQRLFAEFAKAEDGAITVDWVVLTAAMIGLGLAVVSVVTDGALDTSSGLGAFLGGLAFP